MNKSTTVKIPVSLSDLEAAAIHMSVLADGLGAAFENSAASMQQLDDEAKRDWFGNYYNAINGGLACIGVLSKIVCDGLTEVSALRITE